MRTSAPGPSRTWRVLVVESDAEEAEYLASGLIRHGHEVGVIATGEAALDDFEGADLVILDLELPDLDGVEVCRGIRLSCKVPIIAVTSRGTELDCVLALQAGADDYMVKPYGFRELLARMDAVMRRVAQQPATAEAISYGPLHIDVDARRVSLDGRSIEITRKEFDLLHLLASRPGTVVSRKHLMKMVWGDTLSRRTVDTHVSSLRSKLGSSDWITTVRGIGFRFGRG